MTPTDLCKPPCRLVVVCVTLVLGCQPAAVPSMGVEAHTASTENPSPSLKPVAQQAHPSADKVREQQLRERLELHIARLSESSTSPKDDDREYEAAASILSELRPLLHGDPEGREQYLELERRLDAVASAP